MTQAEMDSERRIHPRYSPDPWLPIVFSNPHDAAGMQSAGHIVDISSGGMRIVAPPTCVTPVRWGASLYVTLSYSESNRRAGVEGLVLEAIAVHVSSDSRRFMIRARFADAAIHQRLRDFIHILSAHSPSRLAETPDF